MSSEQVIADDPTVALIAKLRAECGDTGEKAASLIEWLLDERPSLIDALEQERADATRLAGQVDEMAARLNRIGDHLRTLTVYAEGDDDHAAPRDPWPEPEVVKPTRRRKA